MKINKVAVLGSGVMGAQIAAHIANAKIPVYMFDMNQELSEKGKQSSLKIRPHAFFESKNSDLITPLNYDDHLSKIEECDWVVEVIAERLDWKKNLYKKIDSLNIDNIIITSNTSGLSASDLVDDMSENFKRRFFITHFFNPPRYMKLVEIVKTDFTEEDFVSPVTSFLEDGLGKGVVYAKDTPNFIANRIGVYGMMVTLDATLKHKFSVEDVDSLTGTLIGRPKSATYRTADVVGLDTLAFVAKTGYDKCLDDSDRGVFKIPEFLSKMLEKEWLGQKTGQGFYKKIDKGVIHSLDLETLQYTPQNKKRYTGIKLAREHNNMKDRFNALVYSEDSAGKLIWEITAKTLIYSANRLGEVADDIVNIDRAMKWGFGWDIGPFELWDNMGLLKSVSRMKDEGYQVPEWVLNMIDAGYCSFYDFIDSKDSYYSIDGYSEIVKNEKEQSFKFLKKSQKLIKKGWSASLFDLDDGVAGIEFHSVLKEDMNPIDGSIIEMLDFASAWIVENNYKGLVISSDGANFSAGANLNLILNAAEAKDFEAVEHISKYMQDTMQKLRFSPFPVVAAPFGFVLGGGYEVVGACDSVIAASESYIGLVELGVGLIPGAGGNLRMLSNWKGKKGIQASNKAFEVISQPLPGKGISLSGQQAKTLGYLRDHDKIVMNRAHLISIAKDEVLSLSSDYSAPELEAFRLLGSSGRIALELAVKGIHKAGKISDHDVLIAKKLAYVLTGGNKAGPLSKVDEQYLLDIEREAFVSLSGEPKTIDRIRYMLQKGKPLRN
tara:strand:+ start:11014 stop:13341 length:2328 start_codon:yes stop_codon:yes gene_type:complete